MLLRIQFNSKAILERKGHNVLIYKYMQVGILGLSGEGKLIVEKLLKEGHEIVLMSSSKDEIEKIRTENAEFIVGQKLNIVQNLIRKPMVTWLSLAVGEPTESMLGQLTQIVSAGDVIVDCASSHYKDTERRAEEYSKRGVKYLGIGVSGGVHASVNGLSVMVGGDFNAYQFVNPILESLIKPNGTHSYYGSGGAGHFVTMVHDGIETGIVHSISEGISLLKKSEYDIDLIDAVNTWQGGGTISSFLLDMAMDALDTDPNLTQFKGSLNINQAARWMIEDAKNRGIVVPVIAQALDFESRSQYDKMVAETFTARLIQAMRKEVGG
jgi:6-phosphogluconate dehydrogenase